MPLPIELQEEISQAAHIPCGCVQRIFALTEQLHNVLRFAVIRKRQNRRIQEKRNQDAVISSGDNQPATCNAGSEVFEILNTPIHQMVPISFAHVAPHVFNAFRIHFGDENLFSVNRALSDNNAEGISDK